MGKLIRVLGGVRCGGSGSLALSELVSGHKRTQMHPKHSTPKPCGGRTDKPNPLI